MFVFVFFSNNSGKLRKLNDAFFGKVDDIFWKDSEGRHFKSDPRRPCGRLRENVILFAIISNNSKT